MGIRSSPRVRSDGGGPKQEGRGVSSKLPEKGRPATRLVRAGRDPDITGPFVNPPVVHASTVLFPSVEDMESGAARYVYGRRGTPTLEALETALAELDGATGTVLCPSGLNALATAILAFVAAGDHVLLPDNVYHPVRQVADRVLAPFGIAVSYYDPAIGAGLARLLRPETRVVHVESPGSFTMEMADLPAIAGAAHGNDAVVVVDNTWATPLFCRPLQLGADVAVLGATKYIGGHADIMLGTISANENCWPRLKAFHGVTGVTAGPDDVYLALRGLRTLQVRLDRHQQSALAVAAWLANRAEVARVLHPALPDHPGHALWRRDMTGAGGVFSFILDGWTEDEASRFLNGLSLFGLGYSWGGYESLAVPARSPERSVRPWQAEGPLIRLQVGLEDPDDLIADLEAGLVRVRG